MTAFGRLGSVSFLAALAAGLAPSVFAGNVIVVDASGGGNFTRIQSAVNAATAGDTILVKSGTYATFETGKGVAVVADTGANVLIRGHVRIQALPAGEDVLLVGLQVTGNSYVPYQGEIALQLVGNAGSIRVEDCVLTGFISPYPCQFSAGEGAYVQDSIDVVLARCTLLAGRSRSALYCNQGSQTALYECALTSSDACWTNQFCQGPDGPHGITLRGASTFLFASGCLIDAGDGGGDTSGTLGCSCGTSGGQGGNGIGSTYSSYTPPHVLDCTMIPGHGGPPWFILSDCGYWGATGVPIEGGGTLYPGVSRSLQTSNPQRESTTATLFVFGRPRDDVFLYASAETGFRLVSNWWGVQLTKQPGAANFLGTLPASGVLTTSISLPALGIGVASERIYLQAAHRTPQGEWTLGSPVSLVVLDQAF
jgi:hypothetical protein